MEMSGDLFKKAFSKSSEEERERILRSVAMEQKKQDQVSSIKEDVETIISQIPSIFEVTDVKFDRCAKFNVYLPNHPQDGPDDERFHWEVGFYPYGWEDRDTYQVNLRHFPRLEWVQEVNKYEKLAEEAIEIISTELGTKLGEEYARHKRSTEGQ
jgi:hypothetical protein